MTTNVPLQSVSAIGTRPQVGLSPTSPEYEDGIRMEPPPSVPTPNGTRPEATHAAVPLELPPG